MFLVLWNGIASRLALCRIRTTDSAVQSGAGLRNERLRFMGLIEYVRNLLWEMTKNMPGWYVVCTTCNLNFRVSMFRWRAISWLVKRQEMGLHSPGSLSIVWRSSPPKPSERPAKPKAAYLDRSDPEVAELAKQVPFRFYIKNLPGLKDILGEETFSKWKKVKDDQN